MSGKRTYGQYNAERMVGGRKLRYVAKAPVAYSSRWYNTGAARSVGMQTAVARAVRGVAEKKGIDTALTIASVIATTNTNGDCFVLNCIQPGSGSWNRIGRKVNLTSIRLRGELLHQYTDTATFGVITGNAVRMVVVWDKQPSGAAIPAFDVVFGQTSQLGTEATLYKDALRFDNMDRFTVLRDTVIDMKPPLFNGAAGTQDFTFPMYSFDEYIKLGGRETLFSGQSNPCTISDISTGALYVYFRAQANSGTSNQILVSANSHARLRYVDI